MRRLLSAGIICFWLVMVGALVWRAWPSPVASTVQMLPDSGGEEWMGVYQQRRKIGYTRESWSADADGSRFSEESLLRLTVSETSQTVRTRMQGHLNADWSLRDVDFELSSGVGHLQASARVTGSEIRLTLRTGADTTEQSLPITEPVYMPARLRASLAGGHLHAGETLQAMIFDPVTLKNDRIRITVDRSEPVPDLAPVRGWRVHEEYRGTQTQAWIDENGVTLREEGPMGLVLVRQTAEQALNEGWSADAALDLIVTTAVPVARLIDNARQRMALRVRLSGINVETVPNDDEQRRDGAILDIQRADIATLPSYALPCADRDRAADLMPTAFLQSDHPRIQALAREILGGERDSARAARLLNDWVYRHLRKVPTVSIPNALQVLDMGAGDCNEHAVLLAALSRAVGLPARVIAGAVYLDGAFFYHAWCELWLGRWVSVDPTFNQLPADATHIKFVVGGPDEQLAMLGIIGRLGLDVLD